MSRGTNRSKREGNRNRSSNKVSRTMQSILLMAGVVLVVVAGTAGYSVRSAQAPSVGTGKMALSAPIPKAAVEFRMTDLDNGWIRYEDTVEVDGVKGTHTEITTDGGLHWTPTGSGSGTPTAPAPMVATTDEWAELWAAPTQPTIASLTWASQEYKIKQSQFVTERIGWALVDNQSATPVPLLVTADGGKTWNKEVTPEVQKASQDEKNRRQFIQSEAFLYDGVQTAKTVLKSGWRLFPETTSPGDAVLVRHDGPGEVAWQGATYKLQPFAAGYFTYLPMSLSVKAGTYKIGDQELTVKAKKFETQYLQVTQEMEAMKQDTQRILADQKKIDLARSKSAPEFLFTSDFIQPVEGILTTPYGYTRYVNNKYDSSHLAIDLAAKQGTPIKATNDGIVVLAETLYLTGNAIYLDHGMGLFSQYAHMLELKVKTGDRVKKGDIIGLVGTTGFSTGPHLHFTFWLHNVQANPDLFFGTTPFRWQSAK